MGKISKDVRDEREEDVMMIPDREGYSPSFILFKGLIFTSYFNGSYVEKQTADLE